MSSEATLNSDCEKVASRRHNLPYQNSFEETVLKSEVETYSCFSQQCERRLAINHGARDHSQPKGVLMQFTLRFPNHSFESLE